MIRRQLVNLGGFGCDYRIGCGALGDFSRFASNVVATPKRAVLVIEAGAVDSTLTLVNRGLIDAGFRVYTMQFAPDDSVCTVDCALRIQEFCAESQLTCDDVIVSVGGMDVASVVDYVAMSWCGGCACAHVPTTFDAMCLAATRMRPLGLSSAHGCVSFHPHVSLVVCDLDLVMGQSADDKMLGLVYLVAAAMTESTRSWENFAKKIPGYLAGEEVAYIDMLGMAQTAWSGVLKASNPSARKAFNYGQPTARALASCLGDSFAPAQYLAEGLRFEARLAHEVFGLDLDTVFDQDDRLDDLGIEGIAFDLDVDVFIAALKREAYRLANRFMLSIPKASGTIRLATVDDDVLERHAKAYLSSRADLING